MNPVLAGLFTTAIHLSGQHRLAMMLPLCLAIAIVYKTTRCEKLSEVPAAVGVLWVTIVLGMAAVGVGLWSVFSFFVQRV